MLGKSNRYLALLALACGACLGTGESSGGSSDQPMVTITEPRLLDSLCAQNTYTLAGAAKRAHGLTSDSCGFELGPGDGSVSIPVDPSSDLSAAADDDNTELQGLLVNLDGSGDTRWVPLSITSDTGTSASGGTLPVNPRIVVSSDGQHVGLVDIEVKTTIPPNSGEGCSVARHRIVSHRSLVAREGQR